MSFAYFEARAFENPLKEMTAERPDKHSDNVLS
jgi:hypothetical protein